MNYLYNGVELPALPEWDKAKYPYAMIYSIIDSIYFTAMDGAYYWNGYGPCIDQSGIRIWTSLGNGSWGELIEQSYDAHNPGAVKPIWSNYDILNEDGTLYLAASDPVPVDPIDPTSLMMGWLVGRRVAAMRMQNAE